MSLEGWDRRRHGRRTSKCYICTEHVESSVRCLLDESREGIGGRAGVLALLDGSDRQADDICLRLLVDVRADRVAALRSRCLLLADMCWTLFSSIIAMLASWLWMPQFVLQGARTAVARMAIFERWSPLLPFVIGWK